MNSIALHRKFDEKVTELVHKLSCAVGTTIKLVRAMIFVFILNISENDPEKCCIRKW